MNRALLQKDPGIRLLETGDGVHLSAPSDVETMAAMVTAAFAKAAESIRATMIETGLDPDPQATARARAEDGGRERERERHTAAERARIHDEALDPPPRLDGLGYLYRKAEDEAPPGRHGDALSTTVAKDEDDKVDHRPFRV